VKRIAEEEKRITQRRWVRGGSQRRPLGRIGGEARKGLRIWGTARIPLPHPVFVKD